MCEDGPMALVLTDPLKELVSALTDLVATLAHDSESPWCGHFEAVLAEARELFAADNPERAEQKALARQVLRFLEARPGINDYAPVLRDPKTARFVVIPGMEALSAQVEAVFAAAQALV